MFPDSQNLSLEESIECLPFPLYILLPAQVLPLSCSHFLKHILVFGCSLFDRGINNHGAHCLALLRFPKVWPWQTQVHCENHHIGALWRVHDVDSTRSHQTHPAKRSRKLCSDCRNGAKQVLLLWLFEPLFDSFVHHPTCL